MKRNSVLLIAVAFLFAASSAAYATDSSDTNSTNEKPFEMRQVMHEDSMQMRDAMKQTREEFKASMSAAREQMKAQFQAERDAFKAKVAQLKDQRKQTTVTNVTNRFNTINTNQTSRMSQGLTKLSTILDKLSSQAASLKSSGKDTSTVDADIAKARTAITTAQDAVSAQAAKQYIPQVTDDTTLRQNVNTTFTQLKHDLEATHKTVQAAKDAVVTVLKDLAKLRGDTE